MNGGGLVFIPILGILCSSAMVVLVVWLVTRSRQRKVEVQVEMQSKLIDRFGSAPDLIAFLQSPAGRQFVSGVNVAPTLLMRERLLTGFTRSIILTILGASFLFLTFMYDDSFAVPAAILFSLGVGYLIATFVSYKLSGKLYAGEVPALSNGS
jgi:hypothetical protein